MLNIVSCLTQQEGVPQTGHYIYRSHNTTIGLFITCKRERLTKTTAEVTGGIHVSGGADCKLWEPSPDNLTPTGGTEVG